MKFLCLELEQKSSSKMEVACVGFLYLYAPLNINCQKPVVLETGITRMSTS